MTISSTVNKNEYDGNGSTSVFPFTFEILEDSDLLVQTVNKNTGIATTRTDYTVSTNPDRTGSATFTGTLPTSDDLVVLKRQLPQLQSDDLIENGRYSSEVIETALDKLVILIQQMQETVDRSLRLQEGSTALNDINTAQNGYLYNNDGALSFQALTITETAYPGTIGAGADADKPASPAVKDIYFASDTNILYKCITAGLWTANYIVSDLNVTGDISIAGSATLANGVTISWTSILDEINISGTTITGISKSPLLIENSDSLLSTEKAVKSYVDSLGLRQIVKKQTNGTGIAWTTSVTAIAAFNTSIDVLAGSTVKVSFSAQIQGMTPGATYVVRLLVNGASDSYAIRALSTNDSNAKGSVSFCQTIDFAADQTVSLAIATSAGDTAADLYYGILVVEELRSVL